MSFRRPPSFAAPADPTHIDKSHMFFFFSFQSSMPIISGLMCVRLRRHADTNDPESAGHTCLMPLCLAQSSKKSSQNLVRMANRRSAPLHFLSPVAGASGAGCAADVEAASAAAAAAAFSSSLTFCRSSYASIASGPAWSRQRGWGRGAHTHASGESQAPSSGSDTRTRGGEKQTKEAGKLAGPIM